MIFCILKSVGIYHAFKKKKSQKTSLPPKSDVRLEFSDDL